MAFRWVVVLVCFIQFASQSPVQCASLGVKGKLHKPKQQCDLAVYINNRTEALVLVNGPEASMEPEADDCRISMYFEMDEFRREWNKMDPNNIDASRLPPLFYFVINSNKQKVVPYFQDYSTWTPDQPLGVPDTVTKVEDTSGFPQPRRQLPYNTRQLLVHVNYQPRSLLYFGKPKSQGKPKPVSDMYMFITLNEFIQDWNRDKSRLSKLFYFTKTNEVYREKCFHKPQCEHPPAAGNGVSGTVIKTPDLKDLSNGRR